MKAIRGFHRLFLLGALICAPLALPATTYVVDPAIGRMTNAGTADAPWSTLEAVFGSSRNFTAGDELVLRNGDHGYPTIKGIIADGSVTVKAQPGHTPHLGSLIFRNATGWHISGLTISPEGLPAPKRKPAALVAIGADCGAITVRDCTLFSAANISDWKESDWLEKSITGITSAAPDVVIAGNTLRNVRFGILISPTGVRSIVSRNTIENFMSDGLRGLADFSVFEGNNVRNCFAIDGNHDDGFQSYSGGSGGVKVGQGVVRGVVLRGNTFISYTDPAQPFKAAMQGIGCFDGMFEDWVIENNVVVTDMWHGIALYGAVNCRIVNNTVVKNPINAAARTPWIQISPHKHKQPSTGNLVRNNFTPTLNADPGVGTIDHNLVTTDYTTHFVDYPHFDLHLKSTSAAIDQGDPKGAPIVDRRQRPRSRLPDIGAYEYIAAPSGEAAAAQIRARIAAIRDSILKKSAAGIVYSGTPDWSFTGADGVTFDRAGFITRTEALFARVEAVESLDTAVDRIDFIDASHATVEITQTMVRREKSADTGAITRLYLRYRERHAWVSTDDGWKVQRVQFIGTPERRVLPTFDAAAILKSRAEKDAFMRDHPQSPFKQPPAVAFAPLKYFAPDAAWVFHSRLRPYPNPEAVTILDTKGRKRDALIYGYLTLEKDGRSHPIRVYKLKLPNGADHYAVWFTDHTTGDTTYDVGRYLDFTKDDDPDHVYTLDFNLAYNPYCAYTSAFGCAIPRKEDRLDLAITAGEKSWHD